MVAQKADALVEALRAAGIARLVASYEGRDGAGRIGEIELYVAAPHPSRDGTLYLAPGEFGLVHPISDEQRGAIDVALTELLDVRFGPWEKAAGGVLKVDTEVNRVWTDGAYEYEVVAADPNAPLVVEL